LRLQQQFGRVVQGGDERANRAGHVRSPWHASGRWC
jgi:hypothetical protein